MATTIEDALLSRRSCRAFLPDPVPRTELERLLTLAARSASNSNSQPWHVHVLTGAAKHGLTTALLHAHDTAGRVPTREYDYQPSPDDWPEPFHSRRRRFGEGLYKETLGIAHDDSTGRLDHHRRNYGFFGAPVGIILTVSRRPLEGALIDAGLFLQALMLAARGAGLDTCAQASFIDFYPVLREKLPIPKDHLIVCGLALGYADDDHRLNQQRTPREPVGAFTTFYDGD
ncbi:nitroreductase [Amycolatopsis sp.]|uniref:nitroreductase n=1 Tax=Amycolatopsis sp. TaxID=37632 RepID=UPI002E03CC7B|nr:nitroreductase [Amycolatopsis sp.]